MATKHIDIVMEDRTVFVSLRDAILSIGYTESTVVEVGRTAGKRFTWEICAHEFLPRIDVFAIGMLDSSVLTDSMVSRSACQTYGRLTICLLSN